MELTREDSTRIAIELWTWCAKTGKDKYKWSGWEEYGQMENDCSFCEYVLQQANAGEAKDECDACPYYQKFGGCCTVDSLYYRWTIARTVRTSKKYAALFLEQLKQL